MLHKKVVTDMVQRISEFLGAKKRLYKRLRRLVGLSVRPSVCPHITSKTSYDCFEKWRRKRKTGYVATPLRLGIR
jgi:hypothetical protein